MEKNIGGGYVYTESDSSASYADKGFSVEALNDVEINNPENGQALVYDSSSEKWVNGSAGGGGVLIVGLTDGVLSKTWQEIYDAAIENNMLVILRSFFDDGYTAWYITYLSGISSDSEYNEYDVLFGENRYRAESPSDYPEQIGS